MLSSSKLELLDRCEGAFTRRWRDSPNEWSESGTGRHAADEDAINAGDVPDEYTERWPGLIWRSEVRYVYDVSSDTSRFVGTGSTRDYGDLRPFEVPGTVDVEGRGDGMLVVVDRKGFEVQTPADRHPQVRFLALAAARVEPADRIIVAIRPEIGPMDLAEVDPVFDLDVIAHDVKQRVIRAATVRSDARSGKPVAFNTGRWCRWCPAFDDCPRQAELRALVTRPDDDPELAMLTTVVDETDAPAVYELYRRIGILHKRIGQSLHAMAASRPIPIGGGKFYGRREKLGNERLDGDVTYTVVRDLHGQAVADQAVERSASKAQLKRAFKAAGLKVAPAEAAVLAEVRARGGASRKPTYEFEEFTAELQLVSGEQPEDNPPAPEVASSPF